MRPIALLAIAAMIVGCAPAAEEVAPEPEPVPMEETVADVVRSFDNVAVEGELPVYRIPHPGLAAEAYFSPDSQSLITNLKDEAVGDEHYQVYTLKIDGSEVTRINDHGNDACAHFFPDGERLVWTSTRDKGMNEGEDYSDPEAYPTGAELYVSDLAGGNVEMITDNDEYDAEVSISPDGQWILFTRDVDGQLDLWRMRADGTGEEEQITHTPEMQEGGSFYLPDSETILFRAWNRADQGQRGMPMTIFTIKHDGTDLRQITTEEGTNWAPYPAPDGKHFFFVKISPGFNFEVWMMNLETGEQRQMTFSEAFDGFPAVSPDGQWLGFSSSRQAEEGTRQTHLYLMDISSLGISPAG
jgi:Tol biopolymer transport system component